MACPALEHWIAACEALVLCFQLSDLLQRDIEHHPQLSGIIPASSIVHPTIIRQITELLECAIPEPACLLHAESERSHCLRCLPLSS